MITKLELTDKGYRYLLVAKDCFTKWVEIWLLRIKSFEKVGEELHRHFLPCIDIPHWVHVDAGKVFKGVFA